MFRLFGKTSPKPASLELPGTATSEPVSAMSLIFGQGRAHPSPVAQPEPPRAAPAGQKRAERAILAKLDAIEPPNEVSGWARARVDGAAPVEIIMRLDGVEIGRAMATGPREDLTRAGLGECSFTVTTTKQPFSEADVMADRLSIVAICGDIMESIPLWTEASSFPAAAQSLVTFLRELQTMDAAQRETFVAELAASRATASYAGRIPRVIHALREADAAIVPPHPAPDRGLAPVLLPVGMISEDGSAVLGREGWLYLIEGSNGVLHLMQEDPASPRLAQRAAGWMTVFHNRRRRLAEMGITYRQIILPEKLSVVPEHYPGTLRTPSPLLSRIEAMIAADAELAECYVPMLEPFIEAPTSPFRKVDTHLTPSGAHLVCARLIASLGEPALEPPFFHLPHIQDGDLGKRLFGTPLYDVVMHAYRQYPDPVVVDAYTPPNKGHIGRHATLSNSEAPCGRRVVAIGNSFFAADAGQDGVSWWLSRYFRDYHFLWSPDFDYELIARVKPDVVIGQTIERFLTAVPQE